LGRKKYDPLWEVVGEVVPLQGTEPDLDAVCPHCHVRVHVGRERAAGGYVCGLCGGVSQLDFTATGPILRPEAATTAAGTTVSTG